IGKSRTADELASRATGQGIHVLWGRCYESGGAPPFWPWVQVLRTYVQTHDPDRLQREMGDRAAIIAEIVPALREKLPHLPHAEPVQDPEAARFRLFDAIDGFLHDASRAQPLLLVLDNLHAADTPSLLLLEFLS